MDSEDDGEIAILVAAAEAAEQQQGEKRRREAERSMRRRAASALANDRTPGQRGRPRVRASWGAFMRPPTLGWKLSLLFN